MVINVHITTEIDSRSIAVFFERHAPRVRIIAPTAHYSDSPMLRQPIAPTAHFSDNPLLRQNFPFSFNLFQNFKIILKFHVI